jgi:hypothetical protein
MKCDICHCEIAIGIWPFCPHGPVALAIIDDQLEGGPRHFETMGVDAPFIESKSQWKREVKARNLENVDKHDAHYHATWRKQAEEKRRDTTRA